MPWLLLLLLLMMMIVMGPGVVLSLKLVRGIEK